jgi:hypothetical protein
LVFWTLLPSNTPFACLTFNWIIVFGLYLLRSNGVAIFKTLWKLSIIDILSY